MDALNQIDRVLDDLLADGCSDTPEHQKRRLDCVMGFDHIDGSSPVESWRQQGRNQVTTQIPIIFGHKCVICLRFDILKRRKESGVSERILDERKAKARKYSSRTDLAEFTSAVLPHSIIPTAKNFAGLEPH